MTLPLVALQLPFFTELSFSFSSNYRSHCLQFFVFLDIDILSSYVYLYHLDISFFLNIR